MMRIIKNTILMLISLLIVKTIQAQTTEIYISEVQNSIIIVSGNSTIHEWEMKLKEFNTELVIETHNNQLQKINAANVKLKAKHLLSENSIMDEKCHEALKADNYPEITFSLVENTSLKINAENFSGMAMGKLKIAGNTQTIEVKYTGTYKNGVISLKGSKKIKMSDYGLTPPTAMFGSIKTDDEIEIHYQIQLKKKTNNL